MVIKWKCLAKFVCSDPSWPLGIEQDSSGMRVTSPTFREKAKGDSAKKAGRRSVSDVPTCVAFSFPSTQHAEGLHFAVSFYEPQHIHQILYIFTTTLSTMDKEWQQVKYPHASDKWMKCKTAL